MKILPIYQRSSHDENEQSKASRDEVDDPTTNRQHSNHVNQDAEKKGSKENRQAVEPPGEGRVEKSTH